MDRVCYANESLIIKLDSPIDSYFLSVELVKIFYGMYLLTCMSFVLVILIADHLFERERQLRRRAARMRRNRVNTSRKVHYRSFSCRAMFYWTEERKPIEHLSANDLQEIAGADESVEQECATEYCFGGYKSTEIGEVLGNRYEVIRKLGFGHFSTVWLCKDKEVTCSDMYSAVKIVKAAEMFNCVAQDEIKLLRCIKSADPNHPGYKHIIQMLDFFQEHSLNGYHTCISFELMGPSLLHLLVQSDYHGIHLPGVRIILKQLLQGLVYLHNVCRIIHTDIKPENILIKVKDDYVRNLVETSSRYKELGVQMPRTYVSSEAWEHYIYCRPIPPLGPIPGAGCFERTSKIGATRASSFPKEEGEPKMKPEKHSRSNKLHQPMYISPNIEVKIADLGNACWEDHHFSCNIQTKQYRALEVILGADYSFPADMWSVGCLAFELATAEYLFNPKRTSSISSTEDHVYLICETLGSIPRYIAQRGARSQHFFDQQGNLRTHDDSINLKYWKTEDVLVDKYMWKRVDAIPFATFVEGLIEPDPELRLTAAAALTSDWINETF
ncbi:Protein kinase domain [Popillia japonica]|uniref:non-specific serine/threonine protein kinase n=1 Tax=Popillia japonica TaxID=7064 RepID=A0AAW1NJ27_POPJA